MALSDGYYNWYKGEYYYNGIKFLFFYRIGIPINRRIIVRFAGDMFFFIKLFFTQDVYAELSNEGSPEIYSTVEIPKYSCPNNTPKSVALRVLSLWWLITRIVGGTKCNFIVHWSSTLTLLQCDFHCESLLHPHLETFAYSSPVQCATIPIHDKSDGTEWDIKHSLLRRGTWQGEEEGSVRWSLLWN